MDASRLKQFHDAEKFQLLVPWRHLSKQRSQKKKPLFWGIFTPLSTNSLTTGSHSKNKYPYLKNTTPVLVMKLKRGSAWLFLRKVYVQPHQWKVLAETFRMIWLDKGLSWKITKIRNTPVLVSHPKEKRSPKRGFVFCEVFPLVAVEKNTSFNRVRSL